MQRAKKGFTLAELMIALAILALISAIAVPSVISVRNNLMMTERDNLARQIFHAAQQQLLSKKSAGTLDAIAATPMTSKPTDFPGELNAWNSSYVYLDGEDARALLDGGVIEASLLEGNIVIEYNQLTGMVYGAFYSPDGYDYFINDRSAQALRKAKVGYYGGSGVEDVSAGKVIPSELYIVDDGERFYAYFEPIEEMQYTLTISSVNEPENYYKTPIFTAQSYRAPGLKQAVLDYGSYAPGERALVFRMLLDAPFESSVGSSSRASFSNLYNGKRSTWQYWGEWGGEKFIVGEDLLITLEIAREDGAGVPVQVRKTVNSIFQSLDISGEFPVVTISNQRHLQNISTAVSACNYTYNTVHLAQFSAVQTKDIAWTAPNGRDFLPIRNDLFFGYDGGGFLLENFHTVAQEWLGGGIFSSIGISSGQRAFYRDITLVNCSSDYDSNENSGATAGILGASITNADVTRCKAYVDPSRVENFDYRNYYVRARRNAGGLFGAANNTIFNECSASIPYILVEGGNTKGTAGGFVASSGTAATVYNNCYAVLGYATDATGNSFAGGITIASNQGGSAGGFIGSTWCGTFTNCYATGGVIRNVSNPETTGGFHGRAHPLSYNNCYSAVLMDDGFPFVPGTNSFKDSANNYYLRGTGTLEQVAKNDATRAASPEEICTAMDSVQGLTTVASATATNPYGMSGAYPYPRISALYHYGDWYLPQEGELLGLFYYEVYADGSYGFFADAVIDTLNNAKVVDYDGYALLARDYGEEIHTSAGTVPKLTQTQALTDSLAAEALTAQADVYLLPNASEQAWASSPVPFYQALTVTDASKTYYYNSGYAKTALWSHSAQPSEPNALLVRTARHLTQLGHESGALLGKQFTQEREINHARYRLTLTQTPIGTDSTPFSGSYDGGGNIITGVSIQSDASFVGLFSRVSGSLSNIILLSDLDSPAGTRTITGTASSRTGGLLGLATQSARIDNCAVAGFTISGWDAVGGLAGWMGGSLTNSTAVNDVICTSGSSTSTVGGLVGSLRGETLTSGGHVEHCYALGSVRRPGSEGSFYGEAYALAPLPSSSSRIANSYSAVKEGDRYLSTSPSGNVDYNGFNLTAIQTAMTGMGAVSSQAYTFPHLEALKTSAYPFPAVITRQDEYYHYGDWPALPTAQVTESLYYFEQYIDGSYGFRGYNEEGEFVETLRNDLALLQSGFAFLTQDTSAPSYQITYGSQTAQVDRVDFTDTLSGYVITNAVHKALLGVWDTSTPYRCITIDGVSYYYLPAFANTPVRASSTPEEPEVYVVRSADHFIYFGEHAQNGKSSCLFLRRAHVQQERDIDMSGYDNFYPVGFSSGQPFTGSYDGGGYTITGFRTGSSANASGIFGNTNGATLLNIHMVDFTILSGNAGYSAALAGEVVGGSVTNCSVSSSSITGSSNGTGALIGVLDGGTVSNCAVSDTTVTATGHNHGGLIGVMKNYASVSDSILTDVSVSNVNAKALSGSGWAKVGKYVGRIDNSTIARWTMERVTINGDTTGDYDIFYGEGQNSFEISPLP